eukprot:11040421-Ditylum_brightwellii.AAC.1
MAHVWDNRTEHGSFSSLRGDRADINPSPSGSKKELSEIITAKAEMEMEFMNIVTNLEKEKKKLTADYEDIMNESAKRIAELEKVASEAEKK